MPGLYKFPQRERLHRKGDFLKVYREGEKQVGRAFVCYVVRQEGQGRKIGFAVPRKVGGAIVRNRVKRYLREAYRSQRPELVDDVFMVVVARPASAQLTYDECREAVRHLFREGKVLFE